MSLDADERALTLLSKLAPLVGKIAEWHRAAAGKPSECADSVWVPWHEEAAEVLATVRGLLEGAALHAAKKRGVQ